MEIKSESIIISACLVGEICRYDGRIKKAPNLDKYIKNYRLIPVCPEVEGGLYVPRPKSWIDSGTGRDVLEGKSRVVNENGRDVTVNFIKGAKITLDLAQTNHVKLAVLKSKSPSCGLGQVYNADRLVKGNGVTAELLLKHGIEVIAV